MLLPSALTAPPTAFSYQGKRTDNGAPASGQYDLQFKLFDTTALGTGAQFGAVQTLTNVTVTNGVFTVQLDFGACDSCVNGAARKKEPLSRRCLRSTMTKARLKV